MSKERTCLSVQDCIQHAIHRWDLTNVQTVYQTTAKAVLTADSGTYGPVIVKVDMNRSQLKSEYNMLKRLSGEHNCKVFAFDEPSGILMEEQIIPGTTLRKESSFVERIEAFHSIFYGIHRPVNAECAEAFETYLTWLEKIVDFCQNHSIEKTISDWAVLAQEYGIELFDKYQDRFLLHGDFHHDNILLRSDGTYVIIDPKGVVAPAIFDLPRFILNELWIKHENSDLDYLEEIVRIISSKFNISVDDIRKLFIIEATLANIWRIEDGEPMQPQLFLLAEHMKHLL